MMIYRLGSPMRLHKFLAVGIFALFIVLMFVQLDMGFQEVQALPDDPCHALHWGSMAVLVVGPHPAEGDELQFSRAASTASCF